MASIVYILCSLMSLGCAFVLMRAYKNNRTRLLFWSSLCFVGIAWNNFLLSVDYHIGDLYDLSLVRSLTILAATSLLVYGLIEETI
ncbi:DUF5985 family protein [Bdellovibrio reynosensis]|uniref:DUF5985 family protein n=1 Tax=Bdellovibrio reynosensis TaxID=2835041 RepID=A0ABY4C7B5_9BACT|nr:DUF5985 family protein [Bdellovibrio reynosensis]UOF00876.1 DUF5985 family protein [Bdellovibrio reynosensis]